MKFTVAVALFAAAMGAVDARPSETNAHRLARGLPPLPPVRRATPVEGIYRSILVLFSPSLTLSQLLDDTNLLEFTTPATQDLSNAVSI